MVLFNGQEQQVDISAASSTSIDLTWTAQTSSHYFRIQALTVSTTTVKAANYRLDVFETAEPTNTPTPTNTPQPQDWDEYEPNDSFGGAYFMTIATSVTLSDLNFYPYENQAGEDEDWFAFYTQKGGRYRATTINLQNVDTALEIYDRDNDKLSIEDEGALASRAEWEASYRGYYYIRITNKVETDEPEDTYDLTVQEIGAAPTETPGPTATPRTARGEADDCEDNLDFQHACVLAVDEEQTFNFVPAFGKGPDNDFYKIWVKSGLHFRCETSDLAPGLDPNMIMFNGPSWDNAIAGNDDIEEGNYNSAISYYATYNGWLYVLVGTGDRTPPDVTDSSYTLLCEKSTTPFSATRTPGPTATRRAENNGTATPTATASGSPVATATPGTQELTVRPMMTPTPAAPSTPTPRFVPIRLFVYYDGNGDGQLGAGEGIAGISAQAYEVMSNELLAQGFTDEQGSLEFTVSAQGPVRISIPFLGFSYLVTGAEASIQVRVPPHSLPGGTP
jgi:hypothetical protein